MYTITEFLWIFVFLIGLGLVGGFVLIPFRNILNQGYLAAPLAGILILTVGSSALYSMLNLAFYYCMLIIALIGITLTIVNLLSGQFKIFAIKPSYLITSLIIVFIIFYFCNYTSLAFGQPGFLFMDGSDHLTYAQLGDWINTYSGPSIPLNDWHYPYQSWPNHMFTSEYRFGSMFVIAIISALRGHSGMFVYHYACSIVLIASCLAIPTVYSRSFHGHLILLLGLLTTFWFAYGYSGYFGKINSYPSFIFIIGLILNTSRPLKLYNILCLAMLICATASMHFGISIAMFLICIYGTFIAIKYLNPRVIKSNSLQDIKDEVALLLLFVGIAIATTGILTRPLHIGALGADAFNAPWIRLIPRAFDLESPIYGPVFAGASSGILFTLFIIYFLITIYFISSSIKQRAYDSCALLVGPILLIIGFILTKNYWITYQLEGFFYPLALCAMVKLIDNPITNKQKSYKSGPIALLILVIILHLSCLKGSINRYTGNEVISSQQFVESEMDQLITASNNKTITVHVPNVMYGFPILVELGNQPNIKLQWAKESWHAILGYRDWLPPPLNKANYFLVLNTSSDYQDCEIKYKTRQYKLIYCENSRY